VARRDIDANGFATMDETIVIPSPMGDVHLRPERPEDRTFRLRLFSESRPPEWYQVTLAPAVREEIMAMQFEAQTTTYAARFPKARFDIIELDGEPVGRIVVNRPGVMVHIVDHAIVPHLRNRGIGTAIMRALMAEATEGCIPLRLKVADANDPSLKLYLRLGFKPIETAPFYIELEWIGTAL
jgi:RimJ/RimL family protein N-acetyltransferase